MIWWLWTAYPSGNPEYTHTFDVNVAWTDGWPEPDVAWLGEGGWVFRGDTMGLGLRSV